MIPVSNPSKLSILEKFVMPKLATISAQKLIKILKKDGFALDRTAGSHQIFYHPQKNIAVSVPIHKSRDLGRGITKAILSDAQIDL